MNSNHIKNYFSERYPEFEGKEALFKEGLSKLGFTYFPLPEGFLSFKFEGDALVMGDVYLDPKYRQKGRAKIYLMALENMARNRGKRVIIGKSEKLGKKRFLGQALAVSFGGKKAYENDEEIVYWKGI